VDLDEFMHIGGFKGRPLVDLSGDRMHRREFISLLSGMVVAWPRAVMAHGAANRPPKKLNVI